MGNGPKFSITGGVSYVLRLDQALLAYPQVNLNGTRFFNLWDNIPAYEPIVPHSGRTPPPLNNTGLAVSAYLGASAAMEHRSFLAFGAVPSDGDANLVMTAHAGLALSECERTNPEQPFIRSSERHNNNLSCWWTVRAGAHASYAFFNPQRGLLGPELLSEITLGQPSPSVAVLGIRAALGWAPGGPDTPVEAVFGIYYGRQYY